MSYFALANSVIFYRNILAAETGSVLSLKGHTYSRYKPVLTLSGPSDNRVGKQLFA